MNITLYNCTAEPNKLNKTTSLTQKATYTGAVARQNLSIMHPILVLEESISNIAGVNYCYISDFERYYFVREITCDVNGLFTLVLDVDVLMSFKAVIELQRGIVKTNENIYNMYLPGDIKSETRPVVSTIQFVARSGSGYFTNQNTQYVLLGIGGK